MLARGWSLAKKRETLLRCGERAARICVVLGPKKSSALAADRLRFLGACGLASPGSWFASRRFIAKSRGRHGRVACRARKLAVRQILPGEERALLTSRRRLRSISATSSALTLRMRPPWANFSKSALTLSLVMFEGRP